MTNYRLIISFNATVVIIVNARVGSVFPVPVYAHEINMLLWLKH